jgi:hypothetical protein
MKRRKSASQQTLWWREKDSTPQSPVERHPLIKWQRAVHSELCDRRNDQVLDAAKFKLGDGANEAGFGDMAPSTGASRRIEGLVPRRAAFWKRPRLQWLAGRRRKTLWQLTVPCPHERRNRCALSPLAMMSMRV